MGAPQILHGFITFLPSPGCERLPVWQIENGEVIASFFAPLDTGKMLFADQTSLADNNGAVRVMALIPAAQATVRWTAIGGLSIPQAETAARINARGQALGGEQDVHIAAKAQQGGGTADTADAAIMVATMSATALQTGLDILAAHGCDPDFVLPAGLVIAPVSDGYVRARIGDEQLVRGPGLVLPDERALITAIIGEAAIEDLNRADTDQALVAAFCNPAINLRAGGFTKRQNRSGVTTAQWRILALLLCAGLIISLLLAAMTWAKYDRAIAREDAAALLAIQKIVPGAASVDDGLILLQRELVKRGAGTAAMTPLCASAYTILQQTNGVTLREMRYGGDGILALTIASANVDGINQALVMMQRQGYKVTATLRQDTSGAAIADISMRAY